MKMTQVWGVVEDGKRELLVAWDEFDRARNEQLFRQSCFDACLGRDDITNVFMVDIDILGYDAPPEREVGARCLQLDGFHVLIESRNKASGWTASFADGKSVFVEPQLSAVE